MGRTIHVRSRHPLRAVAGLAVLLLALPGRVTPAAEAVPAARLAGGALVLTAWRQARNRGSCAPQAFADTGEPAASPRRAYFAGGWAVAFDLPGRRSAFGIAGTGTAAPGDSELAQWPQQLPLDGGLAGYGLSGRAPYPADDPDGFGHESLAYVRLDGQGCLYNVWSQLGRAHLQRLLQQLRPVALP